MNKEDREFEIDLLQLGRALWGKAIYILLVAVIFGLLGFIGSKVFLTPIYQASAQMIVNTRVGDDQKVSNDQLNSAKSLVDTYAIVIRSRNVLNQVISELELTETYEQLAGCISVKAVNNTQIMKIVVRHSSQATAFAVAGKLMDIAPEAIIKVVGAGSVTPADMVYSSSTPVAPSSFKNAVIAAIVGFALSCAIVAVVFLADNTYKSDLDIQNDLDVPVLGVIPKIEDCRKHSKYGYYGYGHSAEERK